MHHGRHGDAFECTVDGPHRIAPGSLRVVAQLGFVKLDDVGTGGLQVERFGIDRGGEGGIAAQELHVAHLDRLGTTKPGDHARYRRVGAGEKSRV
jgi:hypothetical protein